MNRHDAYLSLRGLLRPAAGDDCGFEAKQLLTHICGDASKITDVQWCEVVQCVARRAKGEPLQYIIGTWSFMGYTFFVDPSALIPRPETELLVESFLSRIDKHSAASLRILDLCCGTGCIGISAVKALQKPYSLTFADCSAAALKLAKKNAAHHAIAARFVQGDLFENISESFDVILCNPPYLNADDMQNLQRELVYEPPMALYGGEDGLDFYRRLCREAPAHLATGAALYMEIGAAQMQAVRDLFAGCEILYDLEKRPRVAIYTP